MSALIPAIIDLLIRMRTGRGGGGGGGGGGGRPEKSAAQRDQEYWADKMLSGNLYNDFLDAARKRAGGESDWPTTPKFNYQMPGLPKSNEK